MINWGIIGCGDVTELKSGPAFNKVPGSALVAVMRRDAEKAKDYALRHGVPTWYSDADELINDPLVNAIYIATPPSSHEAYALAAIAAGKPVYVEKPMSVNAAGAAAIAAAALAKNVKLTVAHYRRGQPLFNKIRALLEDKTIGDIRQVQLDFKKPPHTPEELASPRNAWRVDPAISGGGLFHDLAPHQLDLMYYFFGSAEKVSGISYNQAGLYQGDDIVAGNILFKSGVLFTGSWCFTAPDEKDYCLITGSKGTIGFSFFDLLPVTVTINGQVKEYTFPALQHVQQPMIERTVAYFSGQGPNPCSGEDGVEVMRIIDLFTSK